MLGHRGCRLGIAYPEITEMQARAIFEAAAELTKEGISVYPEIMIPLVGTVTEYTDQEAIVRKVAEKVLKEAVKLAEGERKMEESKNSAVAAFLAKWQKAFDKKLAKKGKKKRRAKKKA